MTNCTRCESCQLSLISEELPTHVCFYWAANQWTKDGRAFATDGDRTYPIPDHISLKFQTWYLSTLGRCPTDFDTNKFKQNRQGLDKARQMALLR